MRNLILISFLATSIFINSSWALPTEYSAIYNAKLKQADGVLATQLKKNGDVYSFELITEPTGFWKVITKGSVIERSRFVIENDQLKTYDYHLIDTIRKKSRESESEFNWSTSKITGYYKDREIDIPLEGKTLSRIVLQLQIMHDQEKQIASTDYLILDKDALKKITVFPEEFITETSVPFGKFQTIKISHQSENSERLNSLWLAPELNFIPIKISQSINGKTSFEANLTQLIF
ncbi:MAG: DUF3108 domain-containing protein [Gammaproteobacteria bacterium]|nr:DUF3108 domain-containing protein [Gammaproteobacteria bacterium]MDC0188717.1 DUF3108 domain-containing protein [Gammaproteobacteria bacterium]